MNSIEGYGPVIPDCSEVSVYDIRYGKKGTRVDYQECNSTDSKIVSTTIIRWRVNNGLSFVKIYWTALKMLSVNLEKLG